ncbi:MAG: sulfite exporter TauE/SafE family protein [Patescibacteria group bacterium]|jgi:sulfite exporter TauE/SafE
MNLWLVFITGLTTGGISCIAMQGGLLASVIANQKRREHQEESDEQKHLANKNNWMPVIMFLSAKLVSHTILGFLLGALGSVLTLSFGVRITFQILAALFMLATALNLLNVHPIFRFVMFQPPKFMQRWVRSTSKANYFFAPAMLGFFTIFIPCGVTQAMEVLAINSGNPITGALTMFMFVLGTAPVFGLIGIVTAKLSGSMQLKFMKLAAILLIFMSLLGINGALQAMDAPVSWQRLKLALFDKSNESVDLTELSDPSQMDTEEVQRITIDVEDNGYSPSRFKVRVGVPVELTVKTENTYSCASAFTFKEFDIYELLDPTDSQTFTFTPQKKGKFVFACSMGMYSGVMEVI